MSNESETTAFLPVDEAALSALGERSDRAAAAAEASALTLPTTESEQWRYSLVDQAPLDRLRPCTEPSSDALPSSSELNGTDWAATIDLCDGFVVAQTVADGWSSKGLSITVDPGRTPDLTVAEDGEETIFDAMHRAFAPGAVVISVPAGVAVTDPILVRNHHGAVGGIGFPHLVVDAGESSQIEVVELVTSVAGDSMSVPVLEAAVGPAAVVHVATVQELDRSHWQFGRQLATIAAQATLSSDVAAFGGHYTRLRVDSRLVGRGSTGNMSAAYYGDGDQVHDFRVFQHHDERDTRSDLLFKGAQDDASGSIYTGLIHIHEGGAGSNAFQTNRNVKLSDDAWAWSVPNLEIENNEVHCSHASTVSPVDGDQQFYLQSRGVPPGTADRLIVAGFYREVIERMPSGIRSRVRSQVQAKLDRRSQEVGA